VIVLDASALLELVLATPVGKRLAETIADPSEGLHAPHLADVEVTQALRRYVRHGVIDPELAQTALDHLRDLDLERHAHEPLLDRLWQLRDDVTAYDAVYIALAEVLACTLVTGDGRLARAPGVMCDIHVLEGA